MQPFIGELEKHSLATGYSPISLAEHVFEWAAVNNGLGWVGGIVGCTLAVRLLLLPVVLRAMRTNRLLANLRPEAEAFNDRIRLFRDAGLVVFSILFLFLFFPLASRRINPVGFFFVQGTLPTCSRLSRT